VSAKHREHLAEELAEFDPKKPQVLAASIDRQISLMQRMSADPALDRSRSDSERAMYQELAPAARPSYSSLGTQAAQRRTGDVAWLPHNSTKEKLAKWVEPATNDTGDKRNLFKQMSTAERG
jgi:hypothetical protein